MGKREENHKKRVYENYAEFTVKKRSREYGRKYSLLEDRLIGLLRSQGHKCALCSCMFNSVFELQLDHNHNTGKARGFLCGRCNTMEGVVAKAGVCLDEVYARLKRYYQNHSEHP